MRYAAFLRGINVGGHKIIKMDELKRLFTAFGLKEVKTLIASGNVLFESSETDIATLTHTIEAKLSKVLGYAVIVFLRTFDEIQAMFDRKPFRTIPEAHSLKKYVTFLGQKTSTKIALPFRSLEEGFEILEVDDRQVYSVSYALPNGRFGNPVAWIEKTFGKNSTTRNWNTINKTLTT